MAIFSAAADDLRRRVVVCVVTRRATPAYRCAIPKSFRSILDCHSPRFVRSCRVGLADRRRVGHADFPRACRCERRRHSIRDRSAGISEAGGHPRAVAGPRSTRSIAGCFVAETRTRLSRSGAGRRQAERCRTVSRPTNRDCGRWRAVDPDGACIANCASVGSLVRRL